MERAVFFDRDGVVNKRLPGDYVKTAGEFEFLPDIFTVLPHIKAMGYLTVVVSNQRGVALGVTTDSDVQGVHDAMQHTLQERCGVVFDDVFYCPHSDADACECRKPKPGMLLDAAEAWGIALADSWMIGDSESDILAGNAAGCRTILIGGQDETAATFVAESLLDAAAIIGRFEPTAP